MSAPRQTTKCGLKRAFAVGKKDWVQTSCAGFNATIIHSRSCDSWGTIVHTRNVPILSVSLGVFTCLSRVCLVGNADING